MKKKSIILTIFTLIICVFMLAGVSAPKKKPLPANQMAIAEEIIEYEVEEETTESENEEDEECETCVCVIGKATLILSPDMAKISACIEKFNEDMTTAKNENLEILNAVMSALKDAGIEENKISLDYFTAHPSYDYSVGRNPVGFYSKSCFSFETQNLNEISSYINILTENGVTNICDICYSLSNIEEEYTNALSQAVENAKTKASKLLNAENLELCSIKEESIYSCNTLCREYVESMPTGNVEIEARVIVEFKI